MEEKCDLMIGDEIGDADNFLKFSHFSPNSSIIKIFANLTIIMAAFQNRFNLQCNVPFTIFGLVLCNFIVLPPFS